MRILFVATDLAGARLMARLLRLRGHSVEVVEQLQEARGRLARQQPDVLVCGGACCADGSAWDFMPRVRDRFGTRAVLLSGYGMEEDKRRSLECGFSAHLVKPVNPEEFLAAIEAGAASVEGKGG